MSTKKQEVGNCPLHHAGVQMVISCQLIQTETTNCFSGSCYHINKSTGALRGDFRPFQPWDSDKNTLFLEKGGVETFCPAGEGRISLGPRLWHQHKTEVCSVGAEAGNPMPRTNADAGRVQLSCKGGAGVLKRPPIQGPAQAHPVLKLNNFSRTEYFLAAPS